MNPGNTGPRRHVAGVKARFDLTIVMIEHQMACHEISDRILVMTSEKNHGRDPLEVRRTARLEAYLGGPV
jgi:ABC-type branched-subunit amino acid transport system ATPase component